MATVTSAMTMVTKPSIAYLITKSLQDEIKVVSVQCYNFYQYGNFKKHCRMQGQVKVWRRKQVQSNGMNNHQPTKVWRRKLVDHTIDQNKNDENLGKIPILC